jgi:hypothetical protein
MSKSIAPLMKARVMATAQYSGEPAAACSPMAVAVIKDTTATGPTANTRLVPNTAYSSKGAMLAYKPTSGGKPAKATMPTLSAGLSVLASAEGDPSK